MNERRKAYPFLPFILSILLHFLAFNTLAVLSNISFFNQDQHSATDSLKDPIQVEKISMDDLQKLRTVGVKDGAKHFSEKVPVQTTLLRKPPLKKLSDLKLSSNKPIVKKTKINNKKSSLSFQRKKSIIKDPSDDSLKKNVLKELSSSGDSAKALKAADFNITFEPPEGISEDELNTMEKIFYSFQKRTFKTYVTSFIQVYNELMLTKPYIKNPLFKEKHKMSGKITFDKEGNIVAIKILSWSPNDGIQELFQNTLQGINSLPNPPKALIQNKEEFTIYYGLNINP